MSGSVHGLGVWVPAKQEQSMALGAFSKRSSVLTTWSELFPVFLKKSDVTF